MSKRERSSAADDIRAYSRNIPVTPRRKHKATVKPVTLETRWRAAAPELQTSHKQLAAALQTYENEKALRQRARKAADRMKFDRAVEAICCNFAAVAMFDPVRGLAVKLGNYASAQSSVYGKHFNCAVELLEKRGLLTIARGHRFSRSSRMPSIINPTPEYWKLVTKLCGWNALRLEEQRELVVINTESGRKALVPRDWLQNAEAEMERINAHLRSVPLSYAGRETIPPADISSRPAITLITPHHRTVRRVFKGRIDRGGRLYDGFWETMPRADRFKHLTINGEPVVNVDYRQLFLRLAYALAKQAPPPGDLYDLTGHDHERAGWASLREGRKKMVNALIFADKRLSQWPAQTPAERAELRNRFPRGAKPSAVIGAIKERHSAVAAEWFEQGRGLELMRLESDILIAVLLRLIDLGIGALPLHDSVIVARSDGEAARRIMLEEARRLTGTDIPVKIDAG